MSDADAWAEAQVQLVEAKLGPLPPAAREQLLAQHRAFYPAHRQREMLLWGGLGLVIFWLMVKR